MKYQKISQIALLITGITMVSYGAIRGRLDNGHFLVAHYGPQCVTEYDMNGKVVWNLDVPGGPHSLTRLPNGHTLIAVAK